MEKYVIMTDSSCDLTQEKVDELGITVVPLSVLVGDKTYANYPDGREIGFKEYYDMLRNVKEAKTSAANADLFIRSMEPILQEGKDILYIGFSSALSNTFNASRMAAEELMAKYPERKVIVVDSLSASLGQGLLVYHTAKEAEKGLTIEETAKFVEDTKLKLCHWFTVDDLFHLKRGGRVSSATAVLGTALGIKPVLHVDNGGRLINMSKARGRKASITALMRKVAESAINGAEQTIFISHGDCIGDAEKLADLVRKEVGAKDIFINYVGPVIGAHSGPGTLAIFFIGDKR